MNINNLWFIATKLRDHFLLSMNC